MTPKTAAELQTDLATLEREQQSVSQLVRSIPELQKAAARATTQNLLGTATVAELNAAQSRLDSAIAALTRQDALKIAIAETADALEWQRGKERREFCESIASEFQATMDTYLAQGKEMLATYRKLLALNNQYQAMVGIRQLLELHQRDLHLPQVHGSLASRSGITSGMEPGK